MAVEETPKNDSSSAAEKAEDKTPMPWQPPTDAKFSSYIEECKQDIITLESKKEQIQSLARY